MNQNIIKQKEMKALKYSISNIIIFQSPFQGELFSKYNDKFADRAFAVVPI